MANRGKATLSSICSVRTRSAADQSDASTASSSLRKLESDLDQIKWFLGALSSVAALVKLADHLGDRDEGHDLFDWSGISDLTEQMVSCAYVGGLHSAIDCLRRELDAGRDAA